MLPYINKDVVRPAPVVNHNTSIQLSKIRRVCFMTAPRTFAKDLSFASTKSMSTSFLIARYAISETCHLVNSRRRVSLYAPPASPLVFSRKIFPGQYCHYCPGKFPQRHEGMQGSGHFTVRPYGLSTVPIPCVSVISLETAPSVQET